MASGWNLWVWLVSVVVRRYIIGILIIITFPYSTFISSFLAASSLFLCSYFTFFCKHSASCSNFILHLDSACFISHLRSNSTYCTRFFHHSLSSLSCNLAAAHIAFFLAQFGTGTVWYWGDELKF